MGETKKFDEILEDALMDNRIQYDSIESAIESQASVYSFNTPSELFHQLPTEEMRQLWRKEIEQAVKNGAYLGLELANDERYENQN